MPTHDLAGPGPSRLFVIRHGEKPDKPARGGHPGTTGIDEAGNADPHSLTPRGWQRAGALAVLFAPSDTVHRAGLAAPTRLLAPDHGSAGSSTHRTTQTVAPLAGRLGIPVETPYPSGKERHLLSECMLAVAEACILICWDHENIPAILDALVATATITPTPRLPSSGWPDDRFDVILSFIRQPGPDRSYAFQQIPQTVLPGDSVTTVL